MIDVGGSNAIEQHDFKTPVDSNSERMAYDFLIENVERNLANLKRVDHYRSIVEDTN